nr:immunoglobulin light chain junction region [Macaca mulatta]MPN89358.1 immunoglobulin light chain junction region [Macaca mulatta]MPN90657.1 immunoglobulin light chain junction region [Macaca mulatta]
CMQVLQTPHSL